MSTTRCTWASGCCQRHPGVCAKNAPAFHGRRSDHPPNSWAARQETAFWLSQPSEERDRLLTRHRSYSDDELLPSPASASTSCTAALVMLENRPLHNASSYWNKVIALNSIYAKRHGYAFLLMAPSRSGKDAKGVYYSWCKIDTLITLVERFERKRLATGQCTWLVFLDSDAYIREQFLSVPQLLASLGPAAIRAELVVGRERDVHVSASGGSGAVDFHTAFALNTGVLS